MRFIFCRTLVGSLPLANNVQHSASIYSPLSRGPFDVCVQIFQPYAVERRIMHTRVHIPDIRTAESIYNQYGQCLAGCNGLYVRSSHPCALHCARFTMALAPVRAYDRCTEGWTQTGSENEPSFKRKRLSLQNRARNPSRNPRASRAGPNTSPRELVGSRRYRLISRRGSLSL